MKAIPIEELAPISPEIHAAALKVGCTHARISEPIWPGPVHKGRAGEELRMVEYSWFKALLLKDTVVFDETEPERFLTVLAEYGLGDVESMQPMRRHGTPTTGETGGDGGRAAVAPSATVPAAASLPERQVLTVYVLEATKAKLEQQANQLGLSLGGLLDRFFGGNPV